MRTLFLPFRPSLIFTPFLRRCRHPRPAGCASTWGRSTMHSVTTARPPGSSAWPWTRRRPPTAACASTRSATSGWPACGRGGTATPQTPLQPSCRQGRHLALMVGPWPLCHCRDPCAPCMLGGPGRSPRSAPHCWLRRGMPPPPPTHTHNAGGPRPPDRVQPGAVRRRPGGRRPDALGIHAAAAGRQGHEKQGRRTGLVIHVAQMIHEHAPPMCALPSSGCLLGRDSM